MQTSTPRDTFYDALRQEMADRARILLGGDKRRKAGRMLEADLVQEALAKLLNSYGDEGLRSRSHNQRMALAWRTMKNLVIDQGRKKGAYLETRRGGDDGPGRSLADTEALDATDGERSAVQTERARALHAALTTLSEQERCFIANVMKTDSVPDAQGRCGWPPNSPYYVLKSLLARLREQLAEHAPS